MFTDSWHSSDNEQQCEKTAKQICLIMQMFIHLDLSNNYRINVNDYACGIVHLRISVTELWYCHTVRLNFLYCSVIKSSFCDYNLGSSRFQSSYRNFFVHLWTPSVLIVYTSKYICESHGLLLAGTLHSNRCTQTTLYDWFNAFSRAALVLYRNWLYCIRLLFELCVPAFRYIQQRYLFYYWSRA